MECDLATATSRLMFYVVCCYMFMLLYVLPILKPLKPIFDNAMQNSPLKYIFDNQKKRSEKSLNLLHLGQV